MSIHRTITYQSYIEIGTYLVSFYRQREKLGVRIYHTDPLILEKVAAKLHLTLVGEIETQRVNSCTELRCSVHQWIGEPIGFGLAYQHLPKGCSHDYVNVSFMGMKMECKYCGRAQ